MSVPRISLHGRGFGLLESVLTLALLLSVAGFAYATFAPASQATQVRQETVRLDTLRRSVTAAYASAQSFVTLTPQRAIDERWLGPGSGDGRSSAWGTVTLAPVNVGGMPGDGWQVRMADLPSGICEQLLATQKGRWTHVSVDGHASDDPSPVGCGPGDRHELVLEQWGGRRPGYTLAPLCVDRTQQWVRAHGADVGCDPDPTHYRSVPGSV